MRNPDGSIFVFPIGAAGVERVGDRLAKRAVEYIKKLDRSFIDDLPGLKQPTGREQLAIYRRSVQAEWEELAKVDYKGAMYHMQRWGALSRRYGPPQLLPQPVYSNGNGRTI